MLASGRLCVLDRCRAGLGLLGVAAFASALAAAEPGGGKAAAGDAPLFREAVREFETMKSTLYQHKTQVDRAAGSYRYDCVGFVSYALRQAAPRAWASVMEATGLPKGRIPSPPRYRAFFASLGGQPRAGWQAVAKAADLRPGDVVAWEHKTTTSSGHAVIVGSLPQRQPDGSWRVKVYDATSAWHGEDSRRDDARAQVLESSGRRSGLGHGVMVFLVDPASGVLGGYRWGPRGKPVNAPMAAARPVS